MWEGGLGARAGDAVRDVEPGEEENPGAAQTSSLFPGRNRERCREPSDTAVPSGWERLLAMDSPVNGQGEGTWMGHKRDTQRGHPGHRKERLFQRSLSRPFQPLIPCDMLWAMTGCGGRGELAVCRERLREKSKGEKNATVRQHSS